MNITTVKMASKKKVKKRVDTQEEIRCQSKKLTTLLEKAEIKYSTLQKKLRSLEKKCEHPDLKKKDEGSVIITECPDCGYWLQTAKGYKKS